MVHCGAAGHNIRTKPGMKGVPVGRLAKGISIEAIEEVCYRHLARVCTCTCRLVHVHMYIVHV